jgi:hypothetical protein
MISQHVSLKSRQHLEGPLAPNTLIQHGQRDLWEAAVKLVGEQCGICVSRIRGADPFCRRRANCDDDQWLVRTERSGGIR